jgi:hypothetical protein
MCPCRRPALRRTAARVLTTLIYREMRLHFCEVENCGLIALDALARRITDFSTKPKSGRSSSVGNRRFTTRYGRSIAENRVARLGCQPAARARSELIHTRANDLPKRGSSADSSNSILRISV